jgi:hypothetical protein
MSHHLYEHFHFYSTLPTSPEGVKCVRRAPSTPKSLAVYWNKFASTRPSPTRKLCRRGSASQSTTSRLMERTKLRLSRHSTNLWWPPPPPRRPQPATRHPRSAIRAARFLLKTRTAVGAGGTEPFNVGLRALCLRR